MVLAADVSGSFVDVAVDASCGECGLGRDALDCSIVAIAADHLRGQLLEVPNESDHLEPLGYLLVVGGDRALVLAGLVI